MTTGDNVVLSQVALKKEINDIIEMICLKGYVPEKKNDQTQKEFILGEILVAISYEEWDSSYYGIIIKDGKTLLRKKMVSKMTCKEFVQHFRKVDLYERCKHLKQERCVKTQL